MKITCKHPKTTKRKKNLNELNRFILKNTCRSFVVISNRTVKEFINEK